MCIRDSLGGSPPPKTCLDKTLSGCIAHAFVSSVTWKHVWSKSDRNLTRSMGDQKVVSTSEVMHSGRKRTFWASTVCHWLYINKAALLETLCFQWCILNWRCRVLLWYNLPVLVGLFQSSHVFKVSGKSDKFSLKYSNLFCVHFLSVHMQLMLATSAEECVPQTKHKC